MCHIFFHPCFLSTLSRQSWKSMKKISSRTSIFLSVNLKIHPLSSPDLHWPYLPETSPSTARANNQPGDSPAFRCHGVTSLNLRSFLELHEVSGGWVEVFCWSFVLNLYKNIISILNVHAIQVSNLLIRMSRFMTIAVFKSMPWFKSKLVGWIIPHFPISQVEKLVKKFPPSDAFRW